MYLRSKALPRRTVLRGLGAALALPFLDAMAPAMAAASQRTGKPAHRFLAFYVPNGMAMEVLDAQGRGHRIRALAGDAAARAVPRDDARALRASTRIGWRFTRVHPAHSSQARRAAAKPRSRFRRHVDGSVACATYAQRRRSHHWKWRWIPGERRRMHGQLELRLHAHAVVAQPDPAAADGVENPRAVFEKLFGDTGTTDVRRAKRGCGNTRACSTRSTKNWRA